MNLLVALYALLPLLDSPLHSPLFDPSNATTSSVSSKALDLFEAYHFGSQAMTKIDDELKTAVEAVLGEAMKLRTLLMARGMTYERVDLVMGSSVGAGHASLYIPWRSCQLRGCRKSENLLACSKVRPLVVYLSLR